MHTPNSPTQPPGRLPRRGILGRLGRHPVSPIALPPVTVRATADTRQAEQRLAALGALEASLPAQEPARPDTEHLCYELTAVVAPALTDIPAGAYTVTFGRLVGTPVRIPPFDIEVISTPQFADAVARHIGAHLADGRRIEVTADAAVQGGTVRTGDRTLCAFRYDHTRRSAA